MRDSQDRERSISSRTFAVIAVAVILAIAALAWENTTHVPSNPGPSGTPGSTVRDQTPPPATGRETTTGTVR
jgi:cell division protein FtsN